MFLNNLSSAGLGGALKTRDYHKVTVQPSISLASLSVYILEKKIVVTVLFYLR